MIRTPILLAAMLLRLSAADRALAEPRAKDEKPRKPVVVQAAKARSAPAAEEEDYEDANVQSAGGIVKFGEPVRVAEGEQIDGPVVVVGSSIRVDGTVNGAVVAVGGSVELGPRSEINGPALSLGGRTTRASGAHVTGPIVDTPGARIFGALDAFAGSLAAASLSLFLIAKLFASLGWMLLGLALAAVFPGPMKKTRSVLEQSFGRSALAGLLLWPSTLAVCLALTLSILGIPLVPLLLAGISAAYLWGFSALAYWLGARMAREAWDSPLASMALGMLLLKALQWVHVASWAVFLLAALPGTGAAILSWFGTRRD